MTVKPVVSVTIPVWNSAEFLADAIESVRAQTFSRFELLIGDDGSEDSSLDVIRDFARKDPRIRFFTQAHQGIAVTRNRLNRMARGKFLAPLDSDDLFLPRKLEKQARYLTSHRSIGVVYGDVLCREKKRSGVVERLFPTSRFDDTWELHDLHIHHSSCLIRRSAMRRTSGYDEKLSSALDDDLWLKLAEVTKFHYLETLVTIVRVRRNSVSFRDPALFENLSLARLRAVKRRYGVDLS